MYINCVELSIFQEERKSMEEKLEKRVHAGLSDIFKRSKFEQGKVERTRNIIL